MNMDNVIKKMMTLFPSKIFDWSQRDEDGFEFDILCFGVLDAERGAVFDAVFDANEEIAPDFSISLNAILFSMDETKIYSPALFARLMDAEFDWLIPEISQRQSSAVDVLRGFERVMNKDCCRAGCQTPNYSLDSFTRVDTYIAVDDLATDICYADAA